MRDDFLRDRFVVEFHASGFIAVDRLDERLVAVAVPVFEVRVHFHFAGRIPSVFPDVVLVGRVVYLGEVAFALAAGQTYPTR